MDNNKIEQFVLNLKGKDRFEKRDKLAQWLQDFIKNDEDCIKYVIEKINLPEDECYRYCKFFAYGKCYFWIDYIRSKLLDSSRLEYIDTEGNGVILFADDFGVKPVVNYLHLFIGVYGVERLYP